jgi:hypothetical protein
MKPMKIRIQESIASVTFLRHGNAAKALAGQSDSLRELTPLGLRQAQALADKLKRFAPDGGYNVVMSSPLERAMKTTLYAACIPPKACPAFGISDDLEHPLNQMFIELMYAPLTTYLQHELGFHLREWGDKALEAVVLAAEDFKAEHGEKAHMVFGGHAVMQPMAALALLEALGVPALDIPDVILNKNLGEAQALGIVVGEDERDFGFLHIVPIMQHAPAEACTPVAA